MKFFSTCKKNIALDLLVGLEFGVIKVLYSSINATTHSAMSLATVIASTVSLNAFYSSSSL